MSNMIQMFSGVYLEIDGLREFHVTKYSPITQKFMPYGVYGNHTNFEKQHGIIGPSHQFNENVFLYSTLDGGHEGA